MRILNLIPSIDPSMGGTVECVRQLYPYVKSQGHDWEVVTFDSPNADFVTGCPFPVHALGQGRTSYHYHPDFVPWLEKNRSNYDVAVIHGIWTYHAFGAWRGLNKHLPYFVYPHGMLDPYFKKAFPLKHLKKLLFWHWAEYRVLRDAAAVCFTCEDEKVLARESFSRYKATEEVVGLGTAMPPEGAGAQKAAFFKAFPDLKNSRYLLFMSRIHPKKGIDLLVKAVGEMNRQNLWPDDLKVVIAGPDGVGWRAELEKLAQEEGVSELLTWPGMLQGDSKWGAIRAAEAFVLPSHQENFGIVVAEALSCGVPVLISNKVNIWREIEQEGAGLVGADTQEGTLGLLQKWLAASTATRASMADNALSCFTKHFEIDKAAQNLLNVLMARGTKGK